MVYRSTWTPRQFEVHRHNDRASQLDPFNDQAVRQSEKLDMLDADDRRATPLLFLTHRSAQRRIDAVDTSFPTRGKHIGNTLAVAGPARDRTRDPVLQVVRMSNDGNP